MSGRRNGLILGVLGLSLILNVVALMRISDLRSDVDALHGDVSRLSSLESQLFAAEQRLDELEKEQEIVRDVVWEIDDSGDIDCGDDVPINVSWEFRELPANADVRLEVRHDQSSNWNGFDAEPESEVGFSARPDMPLSDGWEYRIVAEGDQETRATDPEQIWQLEEMTSKLVVFEIADNRSQDGRTWFRYLLAPMTTLLSPCNQIAGATLTLLDSDEAYATVDLDRGYPGIHLPDGYVESQDDQRSSSASDSGTAFDTALPVPAGETSVGSADYWWTDWVETKSLPIEVELVVTFGDGSTRTINQIGQN